ncbi:MAG: DMT family transporter [Planctomycetes bacterium]|nr:DMT family transporter [Planctomycetota bacterium]
MQRHSTTGRWRLGLSLAFGTALLWGLLPLALKSVLEQMDPYTITWYRLSASAAVLAPFVLRGRREKPKDMGKGMLAALLAVSALGLCGNYIFYLIGLDHLTASGATVLIQASPILLMFGSMALFRERFAWPQWAGFAVFLAGEALFFRDRLAELFSRWDAFTVGLLCMAVAAVVWAAYSLAQKQLLRAMSSGRILLVIYVAGFALFLPFSAPASLAGLDGVRLALLGFCALNTLAAYGFYAESLNHWEASRVGAVLTVVPVFTLAFVALGSAWFPAFVKAEDMGAMKLVGALLVVAGSMLTALWRSASPDAGKAPHAAAPGAAPDAR